MIAENIELVREKCERIYNIEYRKAMTRLENSPLNPKKKRDIARKIAKRKVRDYLNRQNLCEADLIERRDFKMEDLL